MSANSAFQKKGLLIRVDKPILYFGLTLAVSHLSASLRLINSMHTSSLVVMINALTHYATRENGKDTNGMNAYLRIYTRYDVRDKLLFLRLVSDVINSSSTYRTRYTSAQLG